MIASPLVTEHSSWRLWSSLLRHATPVTWNNFIWVAVLVRVLVAG